MQIFTKPDIGKTCITDLKKNGKGHVLKCADGEYAYDCASTYQDGKTMHRPAARSALRALDGIDLDRI